MGNIFADHQHVKCDSKPQVTIVWPMLGMYHLRLTFISTGMFSSCLASERNATSLDSCALSETALLWFQEMILVTDKITDNQQLALVAQSHPKSNLTCMAMTSGE